MKHKILEGKRVAILATDGFEQSELETPCRSLKDAGATVEVVSLKDGDIQGHHHEVLGDKVHVDKTLNEVNASDYDGLMLPGGVFNPDALRMDGKAVSFVRDFYEQAKPIGAICHGPWLLVEADVVNGRTVTSWPSLRTDIKNAGGRWVDEPVHVDQGIVTSRKPDDLGVFCQKLVEEIAEGRHEQRVS